MDVINDYNKTWAIRYLREALADYHKGKETEREDQSRSLMATATRKAQLALEHAFGAPEYLEILVADAIQSRATGQDPKVSLLSTLASVANILSEPQTTWNRELILKITREALQGASTIIHDITSEKSIGLEID